jgi:hypothetical protein
MNEIDEPLKLVASLKPAMLEQLAEEGYARRRDEDLARALAAGPGPASAAGRRSPRPGHRRGWRFGVLSAAAAATAAGLVAGVVVVVAAPGGHQGTVGARHGTAGASSAIRLTAAQHELYRLSAAAAKTPQLTGRYVELTETQNTPAAIYPKDLKYIKAMLSKKLPARVRAYFLQLLKAYGKPVPMVAIDRTSVIDSRTGDTWTYQKGKDVASELPVSRHGSPTAAQFASWPTDPVKLRDLLISQGRQLMAQHEEIPGETQDDLVFQQATNWLWNPLISPALRAAFYKVLAATPGVVVKTNTKDSTGRPATEISRYDSVAKEESATFENPATGAVLESLFSDAGSDVYLSTTSHATLPANPYGGS